MPMQDGVAIVGASITKHGFFPRDSWKKLVFDSVYGALDDANMDPGEIETGFISVTAPEICEQENLGGVMADELAMTPRGFTQVVQACAGGAAGLRAAYSMILSGSYKRLLVVGFEKISDSTATAEVLLGNLDVEFEYPLGYDYVDMMALMETRYVNKYGASINSFASWTVQDRWYSSRNPKAIDYGKPEITAEAVLDAPVISWPLTAPACARACDASSALVLVPASEAKKYTDTPIFVAAVGMGTEPNYFGSKFGHPSSMGQFDIAECRSTMAAAKEAYGFAGITPEDIDFAHVHDCFTINGVIQLEALGIFPHGKGASAVEAGETAIDGMCPTNSDGGRIGLGHPTGATGINMIVESVVQMRGEAGERQLRKKDIGVCQTMGGTNTVSLVTVLKR